MFIWGVTVLGCVMIFVMLFYKLDKEYPQIMKELLERESKKRQKSKIYLLDKAVLRCRNVLEDSFCV